MTADLAVPRKLSPCRAVENGRPFAGEKLADVLQWHSDTRNTVVKIEETIVGTKNVGVNLVDNKKPLIFQRETSNRSQKKIRQEILNQAE